MAFTTGLTLDRAADVVFGDTAQLVDWQSGIATVVPLLTLNLDAPNLVRFEAERLAKLRLGAARNQEAISKLAAGRPRGFLQEVDLLRTGLSCFQEAGRIAEIGGSARVRAEGDRATRGALADILEDNARELENMRDEFRAEIQADLDTLEGFQSQYLDQAEKLLVEGLFEPPMERARILRETRRLFRDVTSDVGANVSCAVWAQYSWLTWQLSANEHEAMVPLEYAVSRTTEGGGLGKSLCARLYAYLLARVDRIEEAYQWSVAAVTAWPCLGSIHERARYAALSGRADVVRRDLEPLLNLGPLGIVMAYGDSAFSAFANELLEGSVREQMRLRQMAKQEISAWENVVRKTSEVRRRVPSISLPQDLTDSVGPMKAANEVASFLHAAQHLRGASSAREDLLYLMLGALKTEKRKRTEAVATARASIDEAMESRDRWIRASYAVHEQALDSARAILSKSDSKAESTQRGCGWGISTGCSILMVYGLLASILSVRGVMIGPHTGWGMFMLTLAGLPVLFALLGSVAYSGRRMILDSQLNSQIAASSEKYDRSREDANEQFRGMIEAGQEQLAEEERQLLRVEEALRIFS